VIQWSTSNAAIATVTSTGLVTAQAPGSAVIRATCEGKSGTSALTVTARPVTVGKTIALSAQALSETGQQLTGRAVSWSSGTPGVAQVSATGVVTGRIVAWSSSAPTVAIVNGSGIATGVSTGTASISATSEGKSGSATIIVGVRTVTVTPNSVAIGPYVSAKLTAVVRDPGGAIANVPVTWSSSNTVVARVAADGTVTGVFPGTAIITATAGTASGTATVTVKLGG